MSKINRALHSAQRVCENYSRSAVRFRPTTLQVRIRLVCDLFITAHLVRKEITMVGGGIPLDTQPTYLEDKNPKWGLAKLPRSEHTDTESHLKVRYL